MRVSPSCSLRVFVRNARGKSTTHCLKALALIMLIYGAIASAPARAQVAGQNVNMVSGTGWTNGDPFLERQNEPSMAVSTRNSSHLFGAANDYRTVDLPGLLGIDERGDAWLGVYKSFDGGLTWRSTLLPGYPLDSSPEGAASPIHGRQAAADPLVRAGSNGLFYLTGIAFDRGANPLSKVFISRFIDLNNKENGDAANENGAQTNLAPRDTVKYVDTHVIDSGSQNRFLDKPWVAVDIPRGTATCTVKANEDGNTVTQKIPAGAIYVTYTAFTTVGKVQNSQILFRRSMDCGVTWSRPIVLSESDEMSGKPDAEGQGTVIAIDPSVEDDEPAKIYVAWRVFAVPGDPDDAGEIRIAKSTNGGLSFDQQESAVKFPLSCNATPSGSGCPFDQGTTGTSFRSNGYPALTVDNAGRIYLAWSQRDSNGDGRIVMSISNRVDFWPASNFKEIDNGPVPDDYGNPFSNLANRGTQFMPTLNFTAGKLILTYYDLRQDHTSGALTPAPEPTCDPAVTTPCPLGNPFSEMRQFEGELFTNPGAVFNAYVNDATLTVRRHTLDLIGSEGVPQSSASSLVLPSFSHFRVSRYEYGILPPGTNLEQAQFNAPNLPMFVQGTAPFMGDYIDVAGTPSMVPEGTNGWKFNTSPAANAVFHATWTDNRDVLPPPDGKSWDKYTPPISASIGATSKFDPTKTPPACVPGYSGMRNQNIYTSTISQGLILTSPQTAKPVLQSNGQPIPREFALVIRNDTNQARTFQLRIPAQPASAQASFLQFSFRDNLAVNIPAFSSASRPVFLTPNAGSKVSFPSFEVDAAETDGAQPPLTASILFNADPTNPFLANPDNAAFGSTSITSQEFYNPAILNPAILNPAILNPAILNPAILNPAILNPAILNPAILNPAILNPNFVVALNPAILNPAILNPAILNNAVANPAILNPAILNTPVSDANYTVTNQGNTSATYQLQLFSGGLPPTVANAAFQIILTKTYLTPGVSPLDGCTYGGQVNNEVLASIDNPSFVTDPTQLGNPAILNSAINNPTFSLAPGDTLQITLRANLTVSDLATFVVPNLSPVVASHSVNTVDVQRGITVPPVSLLITTTSLQFAVTGQSYTAVLAALGGNPPVNADTWSLIGGSLPTGLSLSSAGVISGVATATGTFPFVVQVADTGTPQHTATRNLTINVYAPVAIQTPPLPNAAVGSQYTQVFAATGGLPPYIWSSTGTLPPGLTLSSSGALSGVPTTPGTYTFSVKAADTLGLLAAAPYTILVTNFVAQPAQIAFVVQPSNAVGSQSISPAVQVRVSDATEAVIPNVQVAMSIGNQACPGASLSGLLTATTNASGIASFPNLSIDRGQLGYTLLASAGSASAFSQSFTVNGFCQTGNMAAARRYLTSTLLPNGKVLVTGGDPAVTGVSGSATSELFDPAAGSFALSGTMVDARAGHKATLLSNGQVLISGGRGPNGALATAELYDPTSGLFTSTGAMSAARQEHSSTLLADGRVLIAGGTDPSNSIYTSGAELYDPASGTFSLAGNLIAARAFHTATLLPNGTVLIAGGGNSSGPLAGVEIYDPVTGASTFVGNMSTPRQLHTATLLPNGKVLLAGGQGTSLVALASAELFDPATGTFTLTGNMLTGSVDSNATLLPDGTVLISAGFTSPATISEIYNPATGSFTASGDLVSARRGNKATLLTNGQVLLAGGGSPVPQSNPPLNTAEIYYSTAPLGPMQVTTPSTSSAGPNGTTVFTTTAAFAAATSGTNTIGFNGILPAGVTFQGFNPLVRSGVSFANPVPAELVNVNIPTLYSPNNYPAAFLVNSVGSTGQSAPNNQVNITLPQPTNAVALDYGGLGFKGVGSGTITLSNGFVLPSATLPTVGLTRFTGFVSSTPITSLTFSTTNDDWTVLDLLIASANTALPNATLGKPYTELLLEQGGVGPLTWTLASGTLPLGITLTPGGTLIGTPTSAGVFTFAVNLVDSSHPQKSTTSGTFSLTVSTPLTPLVFAPQTLPTVLTGSTYTPSQSPPVARPRAISLSRGALFPRESINLGGNGVFSGAPAAAGTPTFCVTVTDSSFLRFQTQI